MPNTEKDTHSCQPLAMAVLAIVRTIDEVRRVYMMYQDDEHYRGWSMPGGCLVCGEDDWEWVGRVLKNGSGTQLSSHHKIRTFNTRPRTGWVPNHQVATFFWCDVVGDSIRGAFFPLTAIPEDALGHHKKYVDCLRAHIIRKETMRTGGIWFDQLQRAPEWHWRITWMKGNQFNALIDLPTLDRALEELVQRQESSPYRLNLFDDQGEQII